MKKDNTKLSITQFEKDLNSCLTINNTSTKMGHISHLATCISNESFVAVFPEVI